jgi:hypothetical protein
MRKLSTGLKNAALASGFKPALDGGFLRVYSGTQPATADVAATGTLLVTFYADGVSTGLTFATPANGAMTKTLTETWTGTAVATGTAGWFRFSDAADDPTTISATAKRLDGDIGLTGAVIPPGEQPPLMTMSSLSITSGAIQTINTLVVTPS